MHDGPVDEPIVFNANTLTGMILVRDVLEVISRYAFHSNPYVSFSFSCTSVQSSSYLGSGSGLHDNERRAATW